MRVLCLDVGGTYTKIGIVSNWKVVFKERVETEKDDIPQFIRKVSSRYDWDAMSIAFAGVVSEGRILLSPHLDNEERNLLAGMEKPVAVENDANMFALGEYVSRKLEGELLVGITLGTGVGGGIVLDGRIVSGNGFAGEFGHTILDPDGERCECGKLGCVETFLGERYFKRYTSMGAKELLERYIQGDERAREFWWNYGSNLAYLLSNIIHFISPNRIVIGGGISYAYEAFKQAMLRKLKELVPYLDKTGCTLEVSELKEDAVFIGGYALHHLRS